MKKKSLLSLVLVLCLLLCACGSKTVEKNDEGFIALMQKGLQARWELSDTTTFETDEEYPEYAETLIKAELDALGSLSDYTFSDPALKALAEQYYGALNSQLKGAPYYPTEEYMLYSQYYTEEGYNVRAKIISRLHREYGLTVDDQYADSLQNFVTIADYFALFDILSSQPMVLTNLGDQVETTVKNTSGQDLSQILVEIRFLDASGKVLETTLEYLEEWPAGSENTLAFWSSVTEFETAELRFYDNYNSYGTPWTPMEYVNDLIIDISAENLGEEISYGYGSVEMGRCIVEDFRYEISFWDEGKGHVRLYFSGVKTSNGKDTSQEGHVNFTFVLKDAQGNVAASGMVFEDDIAMGESFTDLEGFPGSLVPGTYRLYIENYYLTF